MQRKKTGKVWCRVLLRNLTWRALWRKDVRFYANFGARFGQFGTLSYAQYVHYVYTCIVSYIYDSFLHAALD